MEKDMKIEDTFGSDLSESFLTKKETLIQGISYKSIEGEFWTSGQRQAANIHEVSYRACFKPQLPAFFIEKFSDSGDVVYDPFLGRGTTAIEAALKDRQVIGNDVNPLSTYFTKPRLELPNLLEIRDRLSEVPRNTEIAPDLDLTMFYEAQTLKEIVALRAYLRQRELASESDAVDGWIRMVATNRLTGHSPGFFSVYSMPPNQAVSQKSQIRINEKRKQSPTYRDTHALILKKSKQLQNGLSPAEIDSLKAAAETSLFLNRDAADTPEIKSETVQLTVTSPPFLDVVQYSADNWLRGWFNDIDMESVGARITMSRTVDEWSKKMNLVFAELFRITKSGGYVAFEVGEVRHGQIRLEEYVVPIGLSAGFSCLGVFINSQKFTKTSNIWGIANNSRGTNSNRIALFRK